MPLMARGVMQRGGSAGGGSELWPRSGPKNVEPIAPANSGGEATARLLARALVNNSAVAGFRRTHRRPRRTTAGMASTATDMHRAGPTSILRTHNLNWRSARGHCALKMDGSVASSTPTDSIIETYTGKSTPAVDSGREWRHLDKSAGSSVEEGRWSPSAARERQDSAGGGRSRPSILAVRGSGRYFQCLRR